MQYYQKISIGVELELQGIALQRCRIGIGILLLFFKRQELVLVFYCLNENWYWNFIGVQKSTMTNPAV